MPPRTPLYWVAVTPTDGLALPPCVGLFVTVGGTVTFIGNGGASVTVTAPSNFYLWGDVRQVLSTGTAATGIFQLR